MSAGHPTPRTFEEALKMTSQILERSPFMAARGGIESETEQLVIGAYRKATGRGRTFSRDDLYVRVTEPFPREAGEQLMTWAQARSRGEPLQYLLGYQTFLHHEYEVNPSVLIPRPETEVLVFEVMQWFKRQVRQPEIGFEVGVGSGCISIELLKLFPGLRIFASEVSEKALETATRNAMKILGNLDRLDLRMAQKAEDVLEPFPGDPLADFIVSNPPYLIDETEMDEDVRQYEPSLALLAPAGDPLYFYRKIVQDSAQYLKPKGMIFFECPHERIDEIAELFNSDWSVDLIPDLNGRKRVLRAEWTKRPAANYLN